MAHSRYADFYRADSWPIFKRGEGKFWGLSTRGWTDFLDEFFYWESRDELSSYPAAFRS